MKAYFKHPFPYFVAIIILLLYLLLPSIAKAIASHPTFASYAQSDAQKIASLLRQSLLFPIGYWLPKQLIPWIVFPYWWIIASLIIAIYRYTAPSWKWILGALATSFLLLACFPNSLLYLEGSAPSQSIGSVANGSIKHAKRIPFRGDNFTTYSLLGYLAGRTFAHETVRDIVLDAYKDCATTSPEHVFVLGESGCRKGGRFLPHRTHQNGLSVDFMVPMKKKGVPYRCFHIANLWGYGMEFDTKGRMGEVEIDFEAAALHLLALKKAAEKRGWAMQKVIFDPVLRPKLLATSVGSKIKNLPFTKRRVIIRHDDHYHIDFKKQ